MVLKRGKQIQVRKNAGNQLSLETISSFSQHTYKITEQLGLLTHNLDEENVKEDFIKLEDEKIKNAP